MELGNRDWTELVKRTREKFGVSLDEAYDLILTDATMRRLVAWRVDRDPECRKQALREIRRLGRRKSRFVLEEGRIRLRDPG